MKRIALVLLTAALMGCGADGAPMRPSANIGLSLGSSGISPSASVGASNGTVSIGAAF